MIETVWAKTQIQKSTTGSRHSFVNRYSIGGILQFAGKTPFAHFRRSQLPSETAIWPPQESVKRMEDKKAGNGLSPKPIQLLPRYLRHIHVVYTVCLYQNAIKSRPPETGKLRRLIQGLSFSKLWLFLIPSSLKMEHAWPGIKYK